MNKFIRLIFLSLAMLVQLKMTAQIPIPCEGKIIRHENFSSAYVDARHVDVWLPASFSPEKNYAVLYMQDGQMLFDSTTTWNKQEWGVDEVLSGLMMEGRIQNCIVVGIWNGGALRHAEYFPQKPFESLPKGQQDSVYQASRSNGQSVFGGMTIISDRYLLFLTKELKPFIDKTYPTKPDRAHTFLAGSSMGALISLYAMCEYPKIFGGAACLSTHWPGLFSISNNPVPNALMAYLEQHLPKANTHRMYFDHGTATLDALYPKLQRQADVIIQKKGFTEANWTTKIWPGQDHSEKSWKSRLGVPLLFLLGDNK